MSQERAQAVNWVCWNIDPPDDDGKGGGGYDDDDSSGGSESKVGQTSGAFPPAIYIGAGVLMGVGIIFVIFRKVLQKPKHPQMMRFDSNMGGGGGEGITLNELRKGAHGKFSAVVDMDDRGGVDNDFDSLRGEKNNAGMDFANFSDANASPAPAGYGLADQVSPGGMPVGSNAVGGTDFRQNSQGLLDIRPGGGGGGVGKAVPMLDLRRPSGVGIVQVHTPGQNDQLFDLPTSQAVVKATDVDVVL